MFDGVIYSQPLRAIGQALEILRVEAFELENDGPDYLVQGIADRSAARGVGQAVEKRAIEHIWGPMGDEPGRMDRSVGMLSMVPVRLDLRYTPRDLVRLESEGRSRRSDSGARPDAADLSQLLRALGGYLDSKQARLLKVTRKGESMTIRYRTDANDAVEEELSSTGLYDLWMRMYLRRSDRRDA